MASSISNLPTELLIQICDYLHTKQDVANFSQCSSEFRAVAAPHLYRHVDLLSTPVFDHLDRRDTVSHRIEALVRTFLRDPNLGLMVQRLAVRLPEVKQDDVKALIPLDPRCEDIVKKILPDTVEPSPQPAAVPSCDADEAAQGSDWESTDESVDEDEVEVFADEDDPIPVFETEAERWIYLASRSKAIHGNVMFTILLLCMPNLNCLDLEMPSNGWRTGFLDRAIQRDMTHNAVSSSRSASFLSHLRQVCFGYSSPALRGESWVGPFILPSVETVYLHHLCGLGPSLSLLRPQSLNITHLELRDCRIPAPSLTRLLSGPKALKTFIYVVGEVQTRAEHYMPISYKSLRIAMEKQKHSLEEIWLDYPHDYHWDNSTSQMTAPMGSLSSFTKLKHLRIAGTYIFGFVWTSDVDESRLIRALPEQIESVCLCHADEDDETLTGLSFVLEGKKTGGRFPQLREIKLEAAQAWYAANHRSLNTVLNSAKENGIDVKLVDNHSATRIEDLWDRRHAALHFTQHPLRHSRRESPWGFYGETSWPLRVSGCMHIPEYNDVSRMWMQAESPESE